MSLSPRTLEAIAFHEAGHAVQVLMEGGSVHLATINAEGRAAGFVRHSAWRLERYGLAIPASAGKYGRVALAGPAATRRHNHRLAERDQMRSDRLAAVEFAERVSQSERERDAVLRLWGIQTEESIERNWHRVQAIAQALLTRKTLIGAEVRDAFDQAHQQWLSERRKQQAACLRRTRSS